MTRTKQDIKAACERFRESWDRHEWMQTHGEWASAKWDDARDEFDAARNAVEEALKRLPVVEFVESGDISDLEDAIKELKAAAEALDGQVLPDESDYIAEGLIDPDNVANKAIDLDVGVAWCGWKCTEGWHAYQVDSALYLNWSRSASGTRHSRDLYVLVQQDYFDEEA